MKTALTYGTFNLLHVGHIHLLERLAALGDRLLVGVSTGEFNLSSTHLIKSLSTIDAQTIKPIKLGLDNVLELVKAME